MSARKVRYMVDDAAPFALHAEGLSIQAITRKNEIPVTIEIEGISRRMLLQFQNAIREELARRDAYWKQQREQLLQRTAEQHAEAPASEPSDESKQPAA